MKFKYLIIILLLACFLCGSVYAGDTNSTDLTAQDADSIMSVDQSVESEDVNYDNIVLQNTTGGLSSDSDDELADGENIIYFDSSVNRDGDGSVEKPYKYFYEEYITDNSVWYFAKGEYKFIPSDDSYYNRRVSLFNNITIIGEDNENTVINFYYTQWCPLSF